MAAINILIFQWRNQNLENTFSYFDVETEFGPKSEHFKTHTIVTSLLNGLLLCQTLYLKR